MNTNNNIKWHKASEYVDKMSKVKDYLGLPKGYGAPEFVSGNCSKEWILEHYDAICPITIEGMDEFHIHHLYSLLLQQFLQYHQSLPY